MTAAQPASRCGASNPRYRHGLSRVPAIGGAQHPLYRRHARHMQVCYSPKHRDYPRYGGRGIEVCPRWHDLLAFVRDVGDPPCSGARLERIDRDGDFRPSNVRWVPPRVRRGRP